MIFPENENQLQIAVDLEKELEACIRMLDSRGRLHTWNPTLRKIGRLSWQAWNECWGQTEGTTYQHISSAIKTYKNPSSTERLIEECSDMFV